MVIDELRAWLSQHCENCFERRQISSCITLNAGMGDPATLQFLEAALANPAVVEKNSILMTPREFQLAVDGIAAFSRQRLIELASTWEGQDELVDYALLACEKYVRRTDDPRLVSRVDEVRNKYRLRVPIVDKDSLPFSDAMSFIAQDGSHLLRAAALDGVTLTPPYPQRTELAAWVDKDLSLGVLRLLYDRTNSLDRPAQEFLVEQFWERIRSRVTVRTDSSAVYVSPELAVDFKYFDALLAALVMELSSESRKESQQLIGEHLMAHDFYDNSMLPLTLVLFSRDAWRAL